MRRAWFARSLASLLLAGNAAAASPARKPQPLELSFYYGVDLRRDRQVQDLEPIWRRAAAAGYTKVMLEDVHFARPEAMDEHYRANAARVKRLAAQLGLEVVPMVFHVGRSNLMLARDPNLAEGLPVRNALFVVARGEARLVADPPVSLRGGPEWADLGVRVSAGIATTDVGLARARFRFRVRVSPFRCYHVSVRVRSHGFSGEAMIHAAGARQALDFTDALPVEPTQDWTTYHLVFDSLDHDQVVVWMGLWTRGRGRLEWTDWRIEEVGLLNVLRRPGAPCVVQGYREGRDYESIRDPGLERARANGEYTEWHEPPVIRTRLRDGTRLRVSWYQPAFFYGGNTTCCPSDSGTIGLLRDEARRMREMWAPRGFFVEHDEIRCLNWDPSCAAQGPTAGAVLAEHMRRCLGLLAGSQVYAWSDMFDRLHNAHADYYLVRGDLAGSWEGLDRDVIIVNWNSRHREESLRFFAGRGHRQIIAGYYDAGVVGLRDWLAAARGVPGVIGVMYTTWRSRYEDLEAFAGLVRAGAGTGPRPRSGR